MKYGSFVVTLELVRFSLHLPALSLANTSVLNSQETESGLYAL